MRRASLLEVVAVSQRDYGSILIVASLSGLASVFALGALLGAGPRTQALAVPAVAVALVSARWTSRRIVGLIEAGLYRTRARLLAKLERAGLRGLASVGAAEVIDRLTQDVATISQAASDIARVVQALCSGSFALFYLAVLSPSAFVVVAALQTVALLLFRAGAWVVDAASANATG